MNNLSKEEIAKLVKNGRMAKGYTQQEIADIAGISLRSVQRIENADVLPRLYTLKVLAQALDIPVDDCSAQDDLMPIAHNVNVLPATTLNKPRKLILTASIGLLLTLIVGAFLSQSVTFPETNFELFLFLIAVVSIYTLGLFKIWK